MTQADRVLEYIERNGSITSLQAVNDLAVIQLPRRIHDLKQRGHHIERVDVVSPNRYGERVRHGVYQVVTP